MSETFTSLHEQWQKDFWRSRDDAIDCDRTLEERRQYCLKHQVPARYQFHWSDGHLEAAQFFDTDEEALAAAEKREAEKDARLLERIGAIQNELDRGGVTNKSAKVQLFRTLRELQAEFDNAPIIDYVQKSRMDDPFPEDIETIER